MGSGQAPQNQQKIINQSNTKTNMKFKNKILNFSIMAMLVLIGYTVDAGQLTDATLTGGTNTIAAGAANTYHTGVFGINNARDVSFALNFNTSATPGAAAAINYTLDTSVDNANWMTNSILFTNVALTTGSNMTFVNPTNTSGVPYFRVGWVSNALGSSIYLTNVSLKVYIKNGL